MNNGQISPSVMNTSDTTGTVILGDTRDLHHHGCEAVLHQLIAGLTDVGIPPTSVLSGLDWQPYRDLCLNAPLVIINGEGALHQARPIVEFALTLAEKRRDAGLKTALVNSSWFANTLEQTRRLQAFDLIALRDGESRRIVRAEGIETLDAPDLAIRQAVQWRNTHRDNLSLHSEPIVCDSTRPEISHQLRDFASRREWSFLPVIYPPTAPRNSKKSKKIFHMLRIARLLGPLSRWLIPIRYQVQLAGEPDIDDYFAVLNSHDGVITGRFHTVCFCLGLRIPVVALTSNSPKIESILFDAGLDVKRRMISLTTLTNVPQFTEDETGALDRFLENSELEYVNLFQKLRNLVATN